MADGEIRVLARSFVVAPSRPDRRRRRGPDRLGRAARRPDHLRLTSRLLGPVIAMTDRLPLRAQRPRPDRRVHLDGQHDDRRDGGEASRHLQGRAGEAYAVAALHVAPRDAAPVAAASGAWCPTGPRTGSCPSSAGGEWRADEQAVRRRRGDRGRRARGAVARASAPAGRRVGHASSNWTSGCRFRRRARRSARPPCRWAATTARKCSTWRSTCSASTT